MKHQCKLSDPGLYALAIADSRPLLTTNARREPVKRVDPTRTTTIQNSFARAINRAFAALMKSLNKVVAENDAFGLKLNEVPKINPELSPGAFAFETDANKLIEFEQWLDEQVEAGILAVDSEGKRLSDDFISRGYAAGAKRAQLEVVKAGMQLTPLDLALGIQTPAERVAALHVRTFSQLKGLTDTTKNSMRRILADGIAQGKGPKEVAREMRKIITVSRNRALTIARTETIRAHHTGNIAEMKRLGVVNIKVMAEWKTAGDDRVCPDCAGLEGRVFTVKRIEGLIPLHPNCRCVAIPLVEGGLPPAGRPDPGFTTTKSDGTPRGKKSGLFEQATGGAKPPGFTFPNQNPVTNEDEVATLLKAIRQNAGDAVADLLELVTGTVGDTLKANRELLTGNEGKAGPRGFIGSTGATGEVGPIGPAGEKGESVRGPRGFIGNTGERGDPGERGRVGPIGMRGRRGKTGTRGDKGKPGRDGKNGDVPDHELKLNKAGDPVAIRFERPGDKWGGWLKLNEENVPFPKTETGVKDLEIKGRRIRFKLPNGDWTRWLSFGGGGGGGGIGEAPIDGQAYSRKDGDWELAATATSPIQDVPLVSIAPGATEIVDAVPESCRAIHYTLSIKNPTTSGQTASELLVSNDGTTPLHSEQYAGIALAYEFCFVIESGELRLKVTNNEAETITVTGKSLKAE